MEACPQSGICRMQAMMFNTKEQTFQLKKHLAMTPQQGVAGAEIEVPCAENPEFRIQL